MDAGDPRRGRARQDLPVDVPGRGGATRPATHEGAGEEGRPAAVFAEPRGAGSVQPLQERAQLLGILHRGFVE